MILAVFGTVYAICLAILALVLINAKPLAPARRADRERLELVPADGIHRTLHDFVQEHGRELVATHH